jgi:hypothetical protein
VSASRTPPACIVHTGELRPCCCPMLRVVAGF